MLIELISEYGLFLLKVITIVVSLIILIGVILNSKKTTVEGNLIVKVSGDLVAVIDGVINHYHDPRRYDVLGNVNRAVYGYWKKQE